MPSVSSIIIYCFCLYYSVGCYLHSPFHTRSDPPRLHASRSFGLAARWPFRIIALKYLVKYIVFMKPVNKTHMGFDTHGTRCYPRVLSRVLYPRAWVWVWHGYGCGLGLSHPWVTRDAH